MDALSASWPYELQNFGFVREHLSSEVPSEHWETHESFSRSVPTGQPQSEAYWTSAREAVQYMGLLGEQEFMLVPSEHFGCAEGAADAPPEVPLTGCGGPAGCVWK
jgi:hypothetical protein